MLSNDDRGFTLIELIITMVILGLIMGAIVGTIFTSLRVTDDTEARLIENHDAALTSAYFVSDVQSAETLQAAKVASDFGGACGPSGILHLAWRDPGEANPDSPSFSTRKVTYAIETVDGQKKLRRYYCEEEQPIETITVAELLTGDDPTIRCLNKADEQVAVCNDTNTAAVELKNVTVCRKQVQTGSCTLIPYIFSLKANRRLL